jgi:predicted phage terminase large subunit-like protein
MIQDRKIRRAITKESFFYFFHFYYAHYIKYATADFQKEIIHLIEKDNPENLFIVSFRGSGKSTMITTAYPVWAILGKESRRFILIFCQTQAQAKQHMMNLRAELEDNELLRKDLGPFHEDSDEWSAGSLVFSNTGARITVASVDQRVRGFRHRQNRPDLIICDDIENVASTKTQESRDKIHQWLTNEIIPIGDVDTRLIMVGNLLHQDSLLMRIKKKTEDNSIDGIFKEYPIVRDEEILWPGKYPTLESIEKERKKIMNRVAWQREYMLQIVSDDDQVILPEWINYYDKLPDERPMDTFLSIDPAISEKSTADYTAMVMAHTYGYGHNLRIYVLPVVVNARLTFNKQLEKVNELVESVGNLRDTTVIVENVAYQDALKQELKNRYSYNTKAFNVKGMDKRARLILAARLFETGRIFFPKTKNVEALISQTLGFGVEKHDDMVDAFSMLCNYAVYDNKHGFAVQGKVDRI